MKRSGPIVSSTLASGAGVSPHTLLPGDVVATRLCRRIVVSEVVAGDARGYPLIPQTAHRHRAELRLPAAHAADLGLTAQAWLIRCDQPVSVPLGAARLGRLPADALEVVQRTARRAAHAEAFEFGWRK